MNLEAAINKQVEIFHKKTNFIYMDGIVWELTPNIYNCVLKYSVSDNETKRIESERDFLKDSNGTCIHNKTWSDPIKVIFSITKFQMYINEKDLTWIGTVHHEYSHAVDQRIIFLDMKPTTPDEIYEWEYYRAFILWSEFFARKTGYEMVLKERVFKDKHANKMTLFLTAKAHIQVILNGIIDSFSKQDTYNLMQFFGKFAMIEDIFPAKFDFESFLKNSFNHEQILFLQAFYKICKSVSRENFKEGLPILQSFVQVNNL